MSDADEQRADNLAIASNSSPAGQLAVTCPRCETPIARVVSYGPTTHEATPCGCRVPGHVLEETGTDGE